MAKSKQKNVILLDGYSMDLSRAVHIAQGLRVKIAPDARARVDRSRALVEKLAAGDAPVYALNTGFGYFANRKLPARDLRQLQINILRSHSGGYGEPFGLEETRLALALRLNLLLKGLSGVRYSLCERLLDLLEHEIYPVVPQYGSVGASGDLIPLAHLGLVLIGEGKVHFKGKIVGARKALAACGLKPLALAEKEGIGFINGTEMMQSVGGLALAQALSLADLADRAAALSFEAFEGLVSALNPAIHAARGQPGQIESAGRILAQLEDSYLHKGKLSHSRVQDPYSLRCAAQIHGPTRDALNYSRGVLERELNAATDNPLVFVDKKKILSGGNFHGQALALAYDFAAIACAELANVSERRLELLSNPHSSNLPAFLAPDGGLNSGYMVFQYLAASLVNENKILSHPASTDSIPGNAGVEDHVSMGMTAARKLRQVVSNTRVVLALELLAAAQAIDLRKVKRLGKGTRTLYKKIRSSVPMLKEDRIVAEDVEKAVAILMSEQEL